MEGTDRHSYTLVSERPIEHAGEDDFNRKAFAAVLARQIMAAPSDSGFTIALTGRWGAGKTSALNLARVDLERQGATVLDFDPWLSAGADDLVAQFFAEVGEQLQDSVKGEPKGTLVARRFKGYGLALRALGGGVSLLTALAAAGVLPVEAIPQVAAVLAAASSVAGATDQAGEVIEGAGAAAEALSEAGAANEGGLRRQRERLRDALVDWGPDRRLVVYVDDLDRIESDGLREVLRLVRLVGDFPNVVYVLAYSQEPLEAMLGEAGGRYLEKIVQATVHLPEIRRSELRRQVATAISGLLDSGSVVEADQQYLDRLFHMGVMPLIRTPRDAKRVMNSLPPLMEGAGGEVCNADLVGIAALQALAPLAFQAVAERPSMVVGPEISTLESANERERAHFESMMSGIGEKREAVRDLLQLMFPWTSTSSRSGGTVREHRRMRRLAHRDVLMILLEHMVPSESVPTSMVVSAFEAFGTPAFGSLLGELDDDRFCAILDRLEDYEGEYPSPHLASSIQAVVRRAEAMTIEEGGTDFRNDYRLAVDRVVLRLIRQEESVAPRQGLARAAFDGANTLSWKLAVLTLVGSTPNAGHRLVDPECESSMRDELGRLFRAASGSQLISEPLKLQFMWRLDRDEEREHVRDCIVADRAVLEAFAEPAARILYSRSAFLGRARFSPRLSKSLAKYLGPVWLSERLTQAWGPESAEASAPDWVSEAAAACMELIDDQGGRVGAEE